jgi:predicted DNA-binding transcriptional regulator YafY
MKAPKKPLSRMSGFEKGFDLQKYLSEHTYMFTGKGIPVKFRASRFIIGEIIDRFGLSVSFSDISENEVTASVTTSEDNIFFWLMQFGEYTQALEPASLRNRILSSIKNMKKKYSKDKIGVQ